jgi:DNA-binding NtrC family response regulator
MRSRILVVDDDELTRCHMRSILELDGYEVETVADVDAALEVIRARAIHLLITDLRLPDRGGLELLAQVRDERMPFGVIVVTAYGDTEVALEAMKAGADDFVGKPFEPERFRLLVARTLERRSLADELEQLRQQMREGNNFHNLISKSPRMRRVFDLIQQVGPLGSTVLIHGETGTGKELVAQAIHAASPRKAAPWIAVNCAALNDSLLESELFGHERGAFTGADRQRKGRFELAHRGTLFLDEIGEISPVMQVKMLRVLQSGRFERVGGTETIEVDVRILAASNKRLEDEVKAGRFRSDLFYRLNVVRVDLPPLRERPEDILLLATHFLNRLSGRSNPPVTEIDPEAMQALLGYSWPGNVRQLENAIKAAVALADGTTIRAGNLPEAISPARERRPGVALDIDRPLPAVTEDLIAQVEREYFAQLLGQFEGNVAQCARHSGLSRRCVTMKLRKYGLDRRRFKGQRESVAVED